MATKKKAAKKAAKPAKKRSRHMGDLGNPHYNTAEDEPTGEQQAEDQEQTTEGRVARLEGVVDAILEKLQEHGIHV